MDELLTRIDKARKRIEATEAYQTDFSVVNPEAKSGNEYTPEDWDKAFKKVEDDETRDRNTVEMGDTSRGWHQGIQNVQAGLYGAPGS